MQKTLIAAVAAVVCAALLGASGAAATESPVVATTTAPEFDAGSSSAFAEPFGENYDFTSRWTYSTGYDAAGESAKFAIVPAIWRQDKVQAFGIASTEPGKHHTITARLSEPWSMSGTTAAGKTLAIFFTAQAPGRVHGDTSSLRVRLYGKDTDPLTVTRETPYIASFGYDLAPPAERHTELSLWPRGLSAPLAWRDHKHGRPRVQCAIEMRSHSYAFFIDFSVQDLPHFVEFDQYRYSQRGLRRFLAPAARARTGGQSATEFDAETKALEQWRSEELPAVLALDDVYFVGIDLVDSRVGTVVDNVFVGRSAAELATFRAAVFGAQEQQIDREAFEAHLAEEAQKRREVQAEMERIKEKQEREYAEYLAKHDKSEL